MQEKSIARKNNIYPQLKFYVTILKTVKPIIKDTG